MTLRVIPTSEEIFGITHQPSNACPLIDETIEYVRGLDLTSFEVNEINLRLEAIRSKAEQIRSWGTDWKDDYKHMLEAYAPSIYQDYLDKKSGEKPIRENEDEVISRMRKTAKALGHSDEMIDRLAKAYAA